MIEKLAELLLAYTEGQAPGTYPMTAAEGVMVLRSDHPHPARHRLARPSLCIVAQGAKWASSGGRRLYYRAGQALLVGVAAPTLGRVFEASPDQPCLVLLLELDPAVLGEVALSHGLLPGAAGQSSPSVLVVDIDASLQACALRLASLLGRPRDLHALGPMIMREMAYWLLVGPQAAAVAGLVARQAASQGVLRAIQCLREHYDRPLTVDALAALARLSASAFHRRFKSLTSLSPLQYQKQLRLMEARRLLLSQRLKVEKVASSVGYESPSQFNREYRRMFGVPPGRHRQESLNG